MSPTYFCSAKSPKMALFWAQKMLRSAAKHPFHAFTGLWCSRGPGGTSWYSTVGGGGSCGGATLLVGIPRPRHPGLVAPLRLCGVIVSVWRPCPAFLSRPSKHATMLQEPKKGFDLRCLESRFAVRSESPSVRSDLNSHDSIFKSQGQRLYYCLHF